MSALPSAAVAGDAAEIERMRALHARQRMAFAAAPYPPAGQRRERLKKLRAALCAHQDRLADAISDDFGGRSQFESKMADVLGPVLEINHALSHLGLWMRSRRRHTELLFATNRAYVMYQPKGVVGIIAPWNFPVYLALGPLIAALAAGNRAMIKMSEFTPRTTAAVRALIAECFDEDEVAVFGGAVEAARAFAALPFDHLVFTGSPAIAPHVMRAAAANLTPVTLELGGKSPAIVAPGADIGAAARAIAHGKTFNCGQICVSPDYALVPSARVEEFAAAVGAVFRGFHAEVRGNADYTSVVNDRQHARLLDLIADARARGATVVAAGNVGPDRRLPLHVVTGVRDDMRIAREEIFGPILPVVGYDTLEQALEYVAARPRPLALYPFGFDRPGLAALLSGTHSGGVTVNDWGWHVFNHDLPFGGSGTSGMGSYHGEEGFRELSHAKAVFKRHRYFPVALFYPPYGTWVQRLTLRFYLGRPRG
ncbi:MAG TPA: coniferyl aldehyde dehydrogenase [Steroidobacteraceae bacterium]|nr:coniferyl aldehyde dehydrogenase [Steroidobacteraceae bacterium]